MGRRTADCLKQPAVPIASSRPRRSRPTLPNTKTIIRLVSSWAEISTGTADCPWHSTLPRANCRPRRSRHTSSPRESRPWATPRGKYEEVNAQSREIGVAEKPSHIQDLTGDALSTSPSIPRTGRQDSTSTPYKSSSCPTSLRPAPPLVGPGSPGDGQSVGPSRLEDDSWAQSAVKLPKYPGLTL